MPASSTSGWPQQEGRRADGIDVAADVGIEMDEHDLSGQRRR
jgi:hypothetical protein